MDSKQRSALRSIAQSIEPIGQVGKGGINENMIDGLDKTLDKRELIKITVLKNAEDDKSVIAEQLASALSAEVVCITGFRIVLYRRSKRENVKHVLS